MPAQFSEAPPECGYVKREKRPCYGLYDLYDKTETNTKEIHIEK